MKIAYNAEFGGFRLSENVENYIKEKLKEYRDDEIDISSTIPRHHPRLIKALEMFKDENPDIAIYESVYDKYFIVDYDGIETVFTPGNIPWVYDE